MIGYAQIAQLVEQRTENPRVAGSIPALGIFYGALAQSVEHLTFNQVVRGSNPRCFTNDNSGNLPDRQVSAVLGFMRLWRNWQTRRV